VALPQGPTAGMQRLVAGWVVQAASGMQRQVAAWVVVAASGTQRQELDLQGLPQHHAATDGTRRQQR
jgi:hypothetical protein